MGARKEFANDLRRSVDWDGPISEVDTHDFRDFVLMRERAREMKRGVRKE